MENNLIKVPITYEADWIPKHVADTLFLTLWNELAWVRHDKVPRREYYVNTYGQPYSYGLPEYARTYESQPLVYPLYELLANVQRKCGQTFETVFLNGYENGSDFLGWHSDDSPEMDDNRPIAIVTLGAEREIWFRERPDLPKHQPEPVPENVPDSLMSGLHGLRKAVAANKAVTAIEITKLKLAHGSLCLMHAGMQDTHQHRIPKAGFECGPRISLTFRGYVV